MPGESPRRFRDWTGASGAAIAYWYGAGKAKLGADQRVNNQAGSDRSRP